MTRIRSFDDSGRRIVAELGRAETPEEAAERKAQARATRRANQTAFHLVIALLASLGVVALLVMVVVRPDNVQREPVDYRAAAASAQAAVDVPLAAPALPDGWWANHAALEPADAGDVVSWRIGLITPSEEFIRIVQGVGANSSWVAQQTAETRSAGIARIGGVEWRIYDRRDVDDAGLVAYALVAEFGRSTVVLGGTAPDAEFAILAEAVASQLEASGT